MSLSFRRYLERIYHDLVLGPRGYGRSVDSSVWEKQYRHGEWSALQGLDEMAHYAIIGGLAAVHQFCRVGKMSIIGGCAKVVQDVPPFMIVDGHPGKTRGVNKVGLERHGVPAEVVRALTEVYKIVFKSELTLAKALDKVCSELPQSQELTHFVDFCRKSERGIAR